MSISRGMNKEDVVCIHSGILFTHKNEIMPFGTAWMDLEIIIRSEEVRERKTNMISLTHGIFRSDTNELI